MHTQTDTNQDQLRLELLCVEVSAGWVSSHPYRSDLYVLAEDKALR
ncbi:MAG: hypothetical protein ABL860_07780 [Candidatus Nitrotoga sp.]